MKCDRGTILDSGYTLNPNSKFTKEFVESLLKKGKKNWTYQEKKQFKEATFGSNKYSVLGIILFLITTVLGGQTVGGIIGMLLTSAIPFFKDSSITPTLENPLGLTNLGMIVLTLTSFAGIFLAIVLLAKPFLNTNLKHLIAGRKKFDWKLFFIIFVSYFILAGLIMAVTTIGNLKFESINWMLLLPSFLFMIIFLPMQTTTEEVYFRCLLSRIFYKNNLPKGPKALILIFVSGILFMVVHLANPEVLHTTNIIGTSLMAATYFISGAGLMLIGLISGSFVTSVAVHCANNIFAATIVREEVSVLSTPTLFINMTNENLELITFLTTLFLYAAMIAITLIYKKNK